ncbi:peptidoglycan-binding protein [Magnetospirillum sp. LM-5]|uniref:peptidoglycan-binding protein n=1 Tax=Magnetospirillum sp. LM-5 TaxID=2681466 RepID=UPI001C2D0D27|nr:peptidoglycan-binding protein [Magnetospirillum sp. LM-5]
MNFFSGGRQAFDNDYFSLGAPVGPDQPNRREDVIKVETLLGNSGHLDLTKTDGPLGLWGERPEKAVKDYQSDQGLKVDGLLKPNGPTIGSLQRTTGGLMGDATPPTPSQVDDHHDRLRMGEPGLLNLRPARLSLPKPGQPLELDEQSQAFNADSADVLTRTNTNGDLGRIYANYVKEAGPDAHPTVYDLAEQINATSGRDRADAILHDIVKQLPGDHAKALLGGDPPSPRPLGVLADQLPDDDKAPLFKNPEPVQTAMADSKTMSDAEPDAVSPAETASPPAGEAPPTSGQEPPVQTAQAAQILRGLGRGGAAVPGAAGALMWYEEAVKKQRENQGAAGPSSNQTIVVDPEAGKPQILKGPDPSQPQAQPGTPPSVPPQPVPPLPPSPAQPPKVPDLEGRPAEPPRKPEPMELKTLEPHQQLDHTNGAPLHDKTRGGLDRVVKDPELRAKIENEMIKTGKTTAFGDEGVVVDAGRGGIAGAMKEFDEARTQAGVPATAVRDVGDGMKTFTDPKTGIKYTFRPESSAERRPTVDAVVESGKDKFHIKRRH